MTDKIRKCANCGKDFTPKGHESCCSMACATALRMRNSKQFDCICQIPECGEHFTSTNRNAKYCPRTHYRKCANPTCENTFVVDTSSTRKASRKCCSASCSSVLSHLGGKDKEARRKNSLKKWGTESPLQSEDVKNRIKKTLNANNASNRNISNINRINNVITDENAALASEHADSIMNDSSAKNTQNNNNAHRKSDDITDQHESKDNISTTISTPAKHKDYGFRNTHGPIVKTKDEQHNDALHADITGISTADYGVVSNEIKNEYPASILASNDAGRLLTTDDVSSELKKYWLDNYDATLNDIMNDGNYVENHRVNKLTRHIARMLHDDIDCDIVFNPSIGNGMTADMMCVYGNRKVIIDINPTITHTMDSPFACLLNDCEQPCEQHVNIIDKNYHLKRAQSATEFIPNTPYIQFYEWNTYNEIYKLVSARLKPISTKISAHQCEVLEFTSSRDRRMANRFLNENHIQGNVQGASKYYVLIKNDTLGGTYDDILAVATFGKCRFNKNYKWEFIRYAVRKDMIIRGGVQKLFSAFLEDEDPDGVISYVDYNHTTKKTTFMDSLGFIEDNRVSPTIYWSKPGLLKRVNTNSLMKIGADRILDTHYGSIEECGMNNVQIMRHEGWLQVPTAGNRVYTWHKQQ